MSLLPPSLTDLDVQLKILTGNPPPDPLDWANPPPHLTRIEAIQYEGEASSSLPHTLEELGLIGSPFTVNAALRMPQLTRLQANFGTPSDADLPHLIPRKLTNLTLRLARLLPHLPPCLTGLTLQLDRDLGTWLKSANITSDGQAPASKALASLLPHTLRSLCIDLGTLDSSVFMAFPQRLTRLEVKALSTDSDAPELIMSNLPPNLVTFRMELFEGICPINDALPSSLTHLEVIIDEGGLTGEGFEFLPASLKTLNISFCVVPTDLYPLPPCLTRLRLSHWRLEWFSAIPKTTTSLTIVTLRRPTDDPSDDDAFANLPSTLKTLEIWGYKSADGPTATFSSQSFSTLPALTHLYITPKVAKFPSSVLKNLPKVSVMEIGFDNFHLEDLVYVSPSLRAFPWMDFGEAEWTTPGLAQLLPPCASKVVPLEHAALKEEVRSRLKALYYH